MPRKKKTAVEPEAVVDTVAEELNEMYPSNYTLYSDKEHGPLSNDDIEAIAIKLASLFSIYDTYEVAIHDIKLNAKLRLLIDFMDLQVTYAGQTYFTVTKKEYSEMLTEYSKLKAKEKTGDIT